MNTKNELRKKLMGIGFLGMLLVSAGAVQAQEGNGIFTGDTNAKFGFKLGVNLSQLYVNQIDVDNERNKIGIHGGLWLKAPLGELFAIQPELLYTNNGSRINYRASNAVGIQGQEVRYNLNYIQLPVLASLTLGPISFQAGPYASYLISANIKNLEADNAANPTMVADLNENDFHRIDYGLAGGLAVDIKGFQVGARYNHGLREVSNKGLAGVLTNNSKNAVAQVFVAIGF